MTLYKLKIAAKEADETAYGLLLCQTSKNYPNCEKEQIKLDEIIKILSKIKSTSKIQINKNNHLQINTSSNFQIKIHFQINKVC